mgnify:CR=1 FL=1
MGFFNKLISELTDSHSDDDNRTGDPGIGLMVNGVLTIKEGVTELDSNSLKGFRNIQTIIFPSSLRKLDERVIDGQTSLRDLDFSKVTLLRKIPDDFIDGKTDIRTFVVPDGVERLGCNFLGDTDTRGDIYLPATLREMDGDISYGEKFNVYLFAHHCDMESATGSIRSLYVNDDDYKFYRDRVGSDVRLCVMPKAQLNFYQEYMKPVAAVPAAPEPASAETASAGQPAVGDGLFSARLELLIESALKDGVLTDQERAVILRRAEKEGEDPDEVNMILDARLEEVRKKNAAESIQPVMPPPPVVPVAAEVSTQPPTPPSQPVMPPPPPKPVTPTLQFSDELQTLIDAALEDGVLTDKERNVLKKRAVMEGCDADEFDIILETRLKQRHQSTAGSNKHGVVRKCPACGAMVEAGHVKCEVCGHVFMGVEANLSSQKLAQKLEEVEGRFRDKKDSFFENVTVKKYTELATVISSFPVPTSKEDLLEFIPAMLAKWKSQPKHGWNPLRDAYKAKYEECMMKAKIHFSNDPDFKPILNSGKESGSIKGFFGKMFS